VADNDTSSRCNKHDRPLMLVHPTDRYRSARAPLKRTGSQFLTRTELTRYELTEVNKMTSTKCSSRLRQREGDAPTGGLDVDY